MSIYLYVLFFYYMYVILYGSNMALDCEAIFTTFELTVMHQDI